MLLPPELQTVLPVTRLGAGVYVNGSWVDGASMMFSIVAFVEPAPEERMRALPEGRRTSEGILIIGTTALETANEAAHVQADRVTYAGHTWEVVSVDRLMHFKLSEAHYEILATRVA